MLMIFECDFQNLSERAKKFWCPSVDLNFVTHPQTWPSERFHFSDTVSWKNRLQTRHLDRHLKISKNYQASSLPFDLRQISCRNRWTNVDRDSNRYLQFLDRYHEFRCRSSSNSYQKSDIVLMVKVENVWRTLGRLNDTKLVTQICLKDKTQNFQKTKIQKFVKIA